jgi:hypothetical protein
MKLQFVLDEIDQRKNDALQGEVNELSAYAELCRIRDRAEGAIADIKDSALATLENQYNGKAEDFGFKFEKTAGGRFDYSEIAEWKVRKEILSAIEKMAQEAYKMALKGSVLYDSDGVQVEAANYKPNAFSIKLTPLKS